MTKRAMLAAGPAGRPVVRRMDSEPRRTFAGVVEEGGDVDVQHPLAHVLGDPVGSHGLAGSGGGNDEEG